MNANKSTQIARVDEMPLTALHSTHSESSFISSFPQASSLPEELFSALNFDEELPHDFYDTNGTPLLRGDVVRAVSSIPSVGIGRSELLIVAGFDVLKNLVKVSRQRIDLVPIASWQLELV